MTAPGTHYLAAREQTWQAPAQSGGRTKENEVYDILKELENYEITQHPSYFDQLYLEVDYSRNPGNYQTPAEKLEGSCWFDTGKNQFREIQNGREKRSKCGCIPDLMIRNKTTGKLHFVEVKHQEDAGNAHERCGKYATDLIHHMKAKMNTTNHPISYIFGGKMVKKRKYILELKACYTLFAPGHLVLLDKEDNKETILTWFNTVVKPLLD
jgi:hypothetical protein